MNCIAIYLIYRYNNLWIVMQSYNEFCDSMSCEFIERKGVIMKKIFAFLLAICMVFSLVACDASEGAPTGDGTTNSNEQGSTTNGGDVTNVSTDNTADEGSLTIVETSSGYYATVTHPVISSGYLANDGAIIVNFHFDEQEGWPYFFTINQNFAANFRDEANDEWIAVEHAIVGGNITFMWENLPFNVEDMDYASVIITQKPEDSNYYAEFDIEDVFTFNDNYELPSYDGIITEDMLNNKDGDMTLTIIENYDNFEITATHPDINDAITANKFTFTLEFHENPDWTSRDVYFDYSVSRDDGTHNARYIHEKVDDTQHHIEFVVGDNSVTWICEDLNFDPTASKNILLRMYFYSGEENEEMHTGRFTTNDIFIPFVGERIVQELNFVQCFVDGEDTSYLQMLINQYNAIDLLTQVNLITVSEDEMVDYLLDENNKADIFTVNSYHTADLYNADKLASLDEYMEQAISLDVTGIEQDITDLEYYITEFRQDTFTKIDGDTYSVPLFADSSVLFYNYKEIGFTGSTSMITNYEGLIDIVEWGTNPDLGYYGMSFLLTNKEPVKSTTDTILPILYGNNGSLMQNDTFTVDTPEMLQTMQLIETFGTNGYVMPGTSQKTEEEVIKDFSDEITILLIGSLDNMNIAREKNEVYPEHIFTHNLNKDFSNQMIDNGVNVAISEECSDKDEAWEFVKYITYKNREIAEEIGTYAAAPVSQDTPYVRIDEIKYMPHAEQCLTELTKAGVAVLDGEKTPEQALADCQAEWDRILGQY